jgi:hypothetical protein
MVLIAALSCADDIPGVDPVMDEVYFPIGITTVPSAAGRDGLVVVLSSNFDQRFNAGTLIALSVDGLFAMAPPIPEDAPPAYADALGAARVDAIRVQSFGGDIVYVPVAGGTLPEPGRIFVAARGRNQVLMVRVTPDADTASGARVFACGNPDVDPLAGIDCTVAHVSGTGFADPFPLAHAPPTVDRPTDLVAIGHISGRTDRDTVFGAVALADVSMFDRRVAAEMAGEDLPNAVVPTVIPSFGGASGLAYVGDVPGFADTFVASGFRTAPELVLQSFQAGRVAVSCEDDGGCSIGQVCSSGVCEARPFALFEGEKLRLDVEISGAETRALAVVPAARRAYASVRFPAAGNSSNSGVAVIDLEDGAFRLLAVLELGEELQRPFVREANGRRLLYVGDIRRDKVYVVDVTTDSPVLVQEIGGRASRTIDGEPVQVSLLDGPSQIAFITRDARTLAIVTNFANSTLAVIEVTDPDPRKHRIVARLGRNIDPEGEVEKP